MELKDVILSTLEELEHTKEEVSTPSIGTPSLSNEAVPETAKTSDSLSSPHNETIFLEGMKERIHVLFEGFQSPNNANIEAKVDLTLNFLEYLLSTIEARLKEIK